MPFPIISSGDVIRIEDRETIPVKIKIHICVCIAQHLFMRVNSRPIWPPCHMLRKINNSFLDHDSYVELNQLTHHSNYEIKNADVIGRLSRQEAAVLIAAAKRAETLTDEQKALIEKRLSY
jgi:hypothetical protein